MEKIQFIVENITFQDNENGYFIIKCHANGYNDLITVVGNLTGVHVGATLLTEGKWIVDAKYGKEFHVEKWNEEMPVSRNAIEKYLGSGLIKGVGKKYAKRIVDKFGENSLKIIENDPYKLREVPGISNRLIETIKKGLKEQKEIQNLMIYIQGLDISSLYAAKIYNAYGKKSIDIIKKNPYKLADDIRGIGFKTADEIANKVGIAKNSYYRLRSGILYSLNHLSDNGHCFALKNQLLDEAQKILNVDTPEIEITLDDIINNSDIIKDDDALYLPSLYFSESGCAKKLVAIANSKRKIDGKIDEIISKIANNSKIKYDESQINAIRQSLLSNLLVITGGPGTGKTTITLGIIKAFSELKYKISLAAPTGRAAKRMTEATGIEAKTIHRLLEYQPSIGYQRNEKNTLKTDVLILDECSMIDITLMYNLLKALPNPVTLILIGDIDQLPSVGPGNVLRDIVESNIVPVIRLEKIFRQAQNSKIITNSHLINQGIMPDCHSEKDSDFFFSTKSTNEDIINTIIELCKTRLPNFYHVNAIKDIQVITPMQHGPCGTINMNQLLQDALNPLGISLKYGSSIFRLNDKVMQIINDYDKDIFNGDIGIVSNINDNEEKLTVNFDGHYVNYDVTELDELVLAYVTTIHKAQGSEYPIVIIPITMSHYIMLQRNLLYTAVTRAKDVLVLVGEKKALLYAINNETTKKRNTRLNIRLRKLATQHSNNDVNTHEKVCLNKDYLFARLAKSKFRSGFSLNDKDKEYINNKGVNIIRAHAQDFIKKRLAPAEIPNDGKQTPMRGHPVFIAQHATATCCRGCLEKWHNIPKGHELTDSEQEYIVDVIMEWINQQMK